MRVELGPRDIKGKKVVCVSRDNGEKQELPMDMAVEKIQVILKNIHQRMFEK